MRSNPRISPSLWGFVPCPIPVVVILAYDFYAFGTWEYKQTHVSHPGECEWVSSRYGCQTQCFLSDFSFLDTFDFFHLRLVLGQLVIIVELRHALEFSGSTWGQNLMIFWYSLKIVISPSCWLISKMWRNSEMMAFLLIWSLYIKPECLWKHMRSHSGCLCSFSLL